MMILIVMFFNLIMAAVLVHGESYGFALLNFGIFLFAMKVWGLDK